MQVSDPLDQVFAEHQHSESGYSVKMCDLFDLIVVEIEEDQTGEGYEIFYLRDVVMLQVQESQPLLSFKKGHMGKLSFIEI